MAVFDASVKFVEDLNSTFPSRGRPSALSLYHRLMTTTNTNDLARVKQFVDGYVAFFSKNSSRVIELSKTYPNDAKILFNDNDKISIEIGRYMNRASNDQKEVIAKHLLYIYSLLNPSKEVNNRLSLALKEKTKEESFFSDMMNSTQQMPAMNFDKGFDMGSMLQMFLNSGLKDQMENLKNKTDSGELDPLALLKVLHGQLGNMISEEEKRMREEKEEKK